MKILLTANDMSGWGGVERVVVNLANALSEAGHKVKILSFYQQNENCPYALNSSVELIFLKNIKNIHTKENKLKRLFLKTFYRVYIAFRMKKEFKDFDIMIYNCYFFPYFKNKNTKYIKIHHLKFKKAYSFKNKIFDYNVILSAKELNLWQNKLKNIKIIPNFLPQIPNKNTNHSQKIVLSVGRMTNQKCFERLVEIWDLVQKNAKYKDWKLHIVGDGELKTQIQAKIKEKNLQDTIILKPFTKEIEKEYLSTSIYAMTSIFEGLPMVLVEASSYALPCLAFDIYSGPSDIIEDAKTGFLIKDNDLETYASKLCLLMDNENLRQELGVNAKERMKTKFSKEVIMKQWEQLFKECCLKNEK